MFRQKYLIIGIMALVNVLFCACTKDFLDVNNTQQVFREVYVKDLTTMQQYVRGTYFSISLNVEQGEVHATYPELIADNLRPLTITSSPNTATHYNWMQDAVNGMRTLWSSCYVVIRMCSFVVDKVDEYRGEDAAWADRIKGEALAVRAWCYFKLITAFSQHYSFAADGVHPGVPYITTSDITEPYTRQSVKEVYTGMIADLTKALQLLPETSTDTRFMSRLAVKALLARIYLFKEDFQQAKTQAEEIIQQVPLMTIAAGYPDDLFKLRAPSNTEVLLQLTPASPNTLNRWLRRGAVRFCSTTDMANILVENAGDIRKNWIKDSVVGASTFRLVKKFPVSVAPEAPLVNPEVAYYTPLIRSSEMFLTAAEAAAKTGDENTARTYLNAIRKRADPSIPVVNATGTALIDSIYKERRKELSFEGLRMFDLQRWKMDVTRMDVLPGTPNKLTYPNDKAIAPVPVDEVRAAGIPQNKGY